MLSELQSHSINIPQQIALICFDDFAAATLVRSTITVVRQSIKDLGEKAASLLLDRLNGNGASEVSQIVLPTELVLRESCGCGHTEPAINSTALL